MLKASQLWQKFGGLAAAGITRLWMRTLDYQTVYYDTIVDPVVHGRSSESYEARIFIFWHEYIPFQFYLRGNCNVAMLLSQNRDAEWLARATATWASTRFVVPRTEARWEPCASCCVRAGI